LTDQTLFAPSAPWPTVLGDIQVTVNGTPAPIFTLSSSRIDFQVPQNAPTTGNADFLVTRVSTGEIIAAATLADGSFQSRILHSQRSWNRTTGRDR
jgi:uncharacterized protein (TIGR03437 family)